MRDKGKGEEKIDEKDIGKEKREKEDRTRGRES